MQRLRNPPTKFVFRLVLIFNYLFLCLCNPSYRSWQNYVLDFSAGLYWAKCVSVCICAQDEACCISVFVNMMFGSCPTNICTRRILLSSQWTNTHTHTHPFNCPFSGTTRVSWAMWKSASHSRQITTPALHHSSFYRPDALPAAQPTASKQWTKWCAVCVLCQRLQLCSVMDVCEVALLC